MTPGPLQLALNPLRYAAQTLSTLLSHSYLKVFLTGQIYKGPLKGTCIPVLNCQSCPTGLFSCPIGVIQHHAIIGQVPFFLLGLLGLIGLLVGRMACGWLCPFGFVQDLLHRVKSRKLQLPENLAVCRYFVLVILVLMLPYFTGESWFSILCPHGTLTAAIPWAIWNPPDPVTHLPLIADGSLGLLFVVKVLILVGFIALFVVYKRPFCRLVCPLGLLFSFFNRISLVRLEVSGACSHCDRCRLDCPVDISVHENPNAGSCIRCLKCTECEHVKLVARPLLPVGPTATLDLDPRGQDS